MVEGHVGESRGSSSLLSDTKNPNVFGPLGFIGDRLVFYRRYSPDRPGWIGPGRLAAGIAMLVGIPIALVVRALVALAVVAAVGCALISWDVIRCRAHRSQVREAQPEPRQPMIDTAMVWVRDSSGFRPPTSRLGRRR
jgi:hypothetical protein